MKKIIIFIVLVIIVISAYFFFSKPENNNGYQCPQYTPPAPSFYENCEKEGGTVKSGEKNDKGCQMPPQCVLPKKSSIEKTSVDYSNSPFGFVQGSFAGNYPYYDTTYKDILDLNVHWDRPFEGHVKTMWDSIETKQNGKGNYDFKEPDSILSEVFKKDVNLFISLPAVNSLYGSNISPSNLEDSRFPNQPDALNAYKNFVKAIVKRYSSNVKYWMVSQNEFDDLNPAAKNLGAYSDEGLNNMIKYTKAACEAIKEVCADCRPVLGGAVEPMLSFSKKGEVISLNENNAKAAISDGLYTKLVPAVRNSCKNIAIDYHFWYKSDKKDYKNQRNIIDKIRKIAPGLDIWNTETGTVDGLNGTTEFEQARDIVRLYVYALSYGQKKLFWTNIVEYEWTPDDSSPFDFMGLINNPKNKDGQSHKKLSYYTYKKMVEVLEGSDWDNIQTVQEKDGVYVYKFVKNGKPIWVAWNDNSGEKQITISGVNSSSVKITEAVPNYSSGKEVTNYNTAFKIEIEMLSDNRGTITNNKIDITIGDVPMFVEEI